MSNGVTKKRNVNNKRSNISENGRPGPNPDTKSSPYSSKKKDKLILSTSQQKEETSKQSEAVTVERKKQVIVQNVASINGKSAICLAKNREANASHKLTNYSEEETSSTTTESSVQEDTFKVILQNCLNFGK